MTISEAQSDEESDCHIQYSYNSEWRGRAWALNDTETILVSVFTYIDNWCGRRNPSPARSLHHHKAPQCQGSIWEWWLITAARGWAVHPLVLCRPGANPDPRHQASFTLLEKRNLFQLEILSFETNRCFFISFHSLKWVTSWKLKMKYLVECASCAFA